MAANEAFAPDLILVKGRVLTMDANNSVAEAVAIKDDKILAVGSSDEIQRLASSATEVIDLEGRTALPGLTDCHVHLASDAARAVESVEVRDLYDPTIRSVTDLQARVREWAQGKPPGEWIVGRGSPLADFRFAERRLPTREELDAAAPNNPTYVSFGAHVIMANSAAIKERGVDGDTPSPQGGTVVKDLNTGEPTGMFRERAQYLIKKMASDASPEELAERIALELDRCLQRGVTGIHDIIISHEEVQAYQILARQNRLPVRVQMVMRVIESNFHKKSLLDLGLVQGFGSDWLRIGGIKMSIDGGFTGKNAAFRQPLGIDNEHEHNPGLIRIKQDELDETVAMYHDAGMRCCVHAIGDIAMDMILDAYEKAITRRPRQDHRHRVEHLGNWMMTPERMERTKRLGILPMANPPFLYFLGDPLIEMLEQRATEQGFPFKSMWSAGFPLSFGSDAPGYYPVDPLRDLGTAAAHQTLSGAKLNAAENLTMQAALRTQTWNAAYAGFVEDRLGSLEVGKLADVTVLGDDPMTFPAAEFHHLPIAVTITGGKVVFRGKPTMAMPPMRGGSGAAPQPGGCHCVD
jgi:predicted amidohydrolase YtcJ